MAGRPRKYKTDKALSAAIEKYFASISRTVTLQEEAATGERDEKGRPVTRQRDIVNDNGEPIRVREFLVPPSIGGLCLHLGIHRDTWATYCDANKHPEFSDTTARTRARMENYLENELLTRKKGIQGIIFNLQNNYGWREKRELELGERASQTISASGMSLSEKMALISEAAQLYGAGDNERNNGEN